MGQDWRCFRLKYVADANVKVLPESTEDDFEFVYVDIGNVTQGSMSIDSEPIKFSESPSRARRIAMPGDTVVSTVRTYLRAVASVPPHDDVLIFSTGFAVLSPRDEVYPRFLSWYLQGDEFVSRVEANSTGVSYPAITAPQLMALDVRIPPFEVQRSIADYLDRETARLDTLVEEQQRLVEMLRERRVAAVEAAVANVETDGARLKHSVRSVRQGWSPQCYSWPADGVTTWAVLKAGAANAGVFRPEENKELPEEATPRPDVVVREGDLLVSRANTRDLVGSAAVVEGDYPRLMLCDKLYAFELDTDRALPRFVAAVLGSRRWRSLIEIEATGASHSMLNVSQADIVNLPMPLPPLDEQGRVVAYLGEQTTKIDQLIAETERFIELSKERRAALITAAVTGQIDVRNEVG